MRKITIHRSLYLLSLFILAAAVLTGCQNDVSDTTDTPITTTSGTATINVTLPAGKTITAPSRCGVTIDDDFNYSNGPAGGSASVSTADSPDAGCTCTEGESTYTCTIAKVPAGTYYISTVVFVGQLNGGSPETGDYKGYYGGTGVDAPADVNAVITADQTSTFDVQQDIIP